MCQIKYEELEFDHIVGFTKDRTIFAAGREHGSGHLRIFLIHEDTGNVYTRNGTVDSWEELFGIERQLILTKVTAARSNHIPVYKINGSHP